MNFDFSLGVRPAGLMLEISDIFSYYGTEVTN